MQKYEIECFQDISTFILAENLPCTPYGEEKGAKELTDRNFEDILKEKFDRIVPAVLRNNKCGQLLSTLYLLGYRANKGDGYLRKFLQNRSDFFNFRAKVYLSGRGVA